MRLHRKRGGFTILEIFVAMGILTILVSVAMVGYQGYRDRVAIMVDETNQKVLQAAIKLFAYDNNAMPGSLSDLRRRDMNRAYALVTEGGRPYTMLAHLQLLWQESLGVDVAQAAHFLPGDFYNRELSTVICPSDSSPPTGFAAGGRPTGWVSYGIHPVALAAALANPGGELAWLLDSGNGDVVLIIEVDIGGSAVVQYRHRNGTVAIETTVSGEHRIDVGP